MSPETAQMVLCHTLLDWLCTSVDIKGDMHKLVDPAQWSSVAQACKAMGYPSLCKLILIALAENTCDQYRLPRSGE